MTERPAASARPNRSAARWTAVSPPPWAPPAAARSAAGSQNQSDPHRPPHTGPSARSAHGPVGLGDDVRAADPGVTASAAAMSPHPDHGGLPRPVRPRQAEHHPPPDRQINAVHRQRLPEPLDPPPRLNSERAFACVLVRGSRYHSTSTRVMNQAPGPIGELPARGGQVGDELSAGSLRRPPSGRAHRRTTRVPMVSAPGFGLADGYLPGLDARHVVILGHPPWPDAVEPDDVRRDGDRRPVEVALVGQFAARGDGDPASL